MNFNDFKEEIFSTRPGVKEAYDAVNRVTVRWFDGYLETFDAEEVRFGSDLLWMRLTDGKNRHIPLRQVRWFGMSRESHQPSTEERRDAFLQEIDVTISVTEEPDGSVTIADTPTVEMLERTIVHFESRWKTRRDTSNRELTDRVVYQSRYAYAWLNELCENAPTFAALEALQKEYADQVEMFHELMSKAASIRVYALLESYCDRAVGRRAASAYLLSMKED